MITRRQAKLQRLTAAAESSAPTPDPTPPAVTLVCLPDDALLAVLSYLAPRQLCVCRAVCRRLRNLSLHRDLWRAVHVDEKEDAGLLRAALGLAPCLRKISHISLEASLDGLAAIVARTTCVVAEVELSVGSSSEHEAALATDIILKLSALGGVRKLQLQVSCPVDRVLMALVKSIYSLHGLTNLEVVNDTEEPLPGGWCLDPDETPSLTRLHYFSFMADPFAELLLLTHAATLEEVCLDLTEAVPTSLLTALPRLRSLSCCPSNDLSRLVALPNLTTLKLLESDPYMDDLPPGTLDLLREARHLRRVHLVLPWRASVTAPLVALTASRSAPTLESLAVSGSGKPDTPDAWELVATVPPRFPALKKLAMDCVASDEFVRAVSPASLPGLAELRVRQVRGTCFHAWMHDPAVQDVLVRNPRLHLRVHYALVPERCRCPWCRWGCHRLIRGDESHKFSFSAHPKGDDCPSNCYQVVGSNRPS